VNFSGFYFTFEVLQMNSLAKQVYRFGSDVVDGSGSMGAMLGGKGAGLAEMTMLSVPVPPGFTVTTDVCRFYLEHGSVPVELGAELAEALVWLEGNAGKRFGDANDPMLVSVRSGAPISMPGMMDTVLNVGLNDASVRGLAARSGSEWFALDSYKRLLQMFGSVVLDVPNQAFELVADEIRGESVELSEVQMEATIEAFKAVVEEHTGKQFPQDPQVQLRMAVEAVFRSWRSDRAKFYRGINQISDSMGTAVTVQAMVFGNRGLDSGTGVGFTRNPSTGEPIMFGEYLTNAQGEDIVAGIRTPVAIAELSAQLPEVYAELTRLVEKLEEHYKDTQDFEFTVEGGKLFLLQTRTAKRAALAAVRIAVDMAEEGLITREEAVRRVKPASLVEILSPQLDLNAQTPAPLVTGIPASPGAAVGVIALSANRAVAMHANGNQVVLLTEETTADDIHGMDASVGFLTARGGATSHAAVVARGMGKCCITGAKGIHIDQRAGTVRVGTQTFREGDWLSLDGSTGRVFGGKLPMRPAKEDQPELNKLLNWALAAKTCHVRANADTPADAKAAIAAGATGIGLCRTEHMFFATKRLGHVRTMILAKTPEQRIEALEVLLPMQQKDFEELFRTMSPLPVTIRLLDPPLHEFLPSIEEIDHQIAGSRNDENWEDCITLEEVRRQVELLTEVNPMMGHRGCRLSLTYPEILHMQVRAVLLAALAVAAEGISPCPEIMVPLVASEQEMRVLAEMIHETAEQVFAAHQQRVEYKIGTMIELPRAAVCAGPISKHVSFISFGTNDLTQMTFGFSRDDARNYLESYLEQGILKVDPFVTVDEEGVGYLMRMAIESVREVNPAIKIGVCGEHGGDPESIHFFHSLGVDYVSCSPSRLRIAQLAAAQAGEFEKEEDLEESDLPAQLAGSLVSDVRFQSMSSN
jgi:pyruvate,orthophosphate dikinase